MTIKTIRPRLHFLLEIFRNRFVKTDCVNFRTMSDSDDVAQKIAAEVADIKTLIQDVTRDWICKVCGVSFS